ncbi:MAG: VWA domain-containing protein [Planctomycetes bacterium]|nr:VWA domain-containing protein [Planctomycetota bacterium]
MSRDQLSPAARVMPAVSLLAACCLRAPAQDAPQPVAAWRKSADEVFDDMRRTVRKRDLLAFEKQLAALVRSGAEPRAEFVKELVARLGSTPPGVALNALVERLVQDGGAEAVLGVFEALSTPIFKDLASRELGEKETESRRRILEYYLVRLADRAWAARSAEPPAEALLKLSPELEERLLREVGAEETRRIRCAAYLLGGAGSKRALQGLIQTVDKLEKFPLTKAVVLEAIGRIDPEGAAQTLEAAAATRSEQVRLAALPALGYLKSQTSEDLIKGASDNARWTIRRAAIEACRLRRDLEAMDVLMARFPKETPRLQYDIIQAVFDITGGAVPPDHKEWARWWKKARLGFRPAPRGKQAEDVAKGKTVVVAARPLYFGFEVWSSQLAIVLDVSGSMASSNLSLGTSGVGMTGTLKEGAPIDVAKDQIARLVKSFPARTLFNVIAYNSQVKAFKEALFPASKPNVQTALKFVEALKAEGGTNINDSLMAALKDQDVDTIFYLSDGEPTDGQRVHPDDILEGMLQLNRFRKTRINTIQLGEDQELMRHLAEMSDGKYKLLEVGEKAKKAGPQGKK